jgi:hypothetical protein
MPIQELRQNPMMSHLLDALQQGDDIGHYGRLVFATVERFPRSSRAFGSDVDTRADISKYIDAALLHLPRMRRKYRTQARKKRGMAFTS